MGEYEVSCTSLAVRKIGMNRDRALGTKQRDWERWRLKEFERERQKGRKKKSGK